MRILTTTTFLSLTKSLILQETVLCQQFVRKLAVTPKKQKKTVSLEKLFPDVVKTGHSDPDIAKMIEVMAKERVPSDFADLRDLKLSKKYGTVMVDKIVNKSSTIFDQVQTGHLSSIGPQSETSRIENNWKNLLSKAKVTDPKKALCHLQENLKLDREICSLMSLYLMKDFETLRLPHLPFNYVLYHFAYSANKWTRKEEEALMKNEGETNDVLIKKIPSKNLKQIKEKLNRSGERQKAKIKGQPFGLKEVLTILTFCLEGQNKPKNIEEFHQSIKGLSWTKLAEYMKRTRDSLSNRFYYYVKPVIEGHFLKVDLEEEISRFKQYLVEKKISTIDQIEWSLVPLSRSFYQQNLNIDYRKYPPNEPLWKVLKDRSDKGLMIRNILPEDSRKVLLEEFKKIKASK